MAICEECSELELDEDGRCANCSYCECGTPYPYKAPCFCCVVCNDEEEECPFDEWHKWVFEPLVHTIDVDEPAA